jgi:hypothetical protein
MTVQRMHKEIEKLEKERRLRKSSHEGRRQPELVECQG